MVSPQGVLLDTNLVGRTTFLKGHKGSWEAVIWKVCCGQAMDEDIEEIKGVIKEAFYRPGKSRSF